jgi:hypothetical protein
MITKYGYIALVFNKAEEYRFPFVMPDNSPVVAEKNAYPRYWFINHERATNFCRRIKDTKLMEANSLYNETRDINKQLIM